MSSFTPFNAPEVTSEERTMSLLAHLLGLFTNILAPIIIYFIQKDKSKFVAFHALQAILFQIALGIAVFVSGLLCMVLIGFLLLPIVVIAGLVYVIKASIAANNGELYELPIVGKMARNSIGI
jgi:uncharacterized membrane protein